MDTFACGIIWVWTLDLHMMIWWTLFSCAVLLFFFFFSFYYYYFFTFSYRVDTLATLPDSHADPVMPLSSSLAVTLLSSSVDEFIRTHSGLLIFISTLSLSLSLFFSACDEIFVLNLKEDQIRSCKMTVDFEDCLKDSPRFRYRYKISFPLHFIGGAGGWVAIWPFKKKKKRLTLLINTSEA